MNSPDYVENDFSCSILRSVGLSKKWPRTAAICNHINSSKMLASILDDFLCILDDFLCITIVFLGFPGYLFAETFDLLLFAADQLSNLFLHFTGDVF